MHSIFVAKKFLNESFLLLESDLIYESRALSLVINYEGPDVVLASGKTRSNDEVYIYGKEQEECTESQESHNIVS